jgi:hypothetical protein
MDILDSGSAFAVLLVACQKQNIEFRVGWTVELDEAMDATT